MKIKLRSIPEKMISVCLIVVDKLIVKSTNFST